MDEKYEGEEWTRAEEERQDFVDSAICELIYDLGPEWLIFNWDIELIGIIRDALEEVIVDRLGAMTSYEFYPYHLLIPEE